MIIGQPQFTSTSDRFDALFIWCTTPPSRSTPFSRDTALLSPLPSPYSLRHPALNVCYRSKCPPSCSLSLPPGAVLFPSPLSRPKPILFGTQRSQDLCTGPYRDLRSAGGRTAHPGSHAPLCSLRGGPVVVRDPRLPAETSELGSSRVRVIPRWRAARGKD